VHDPNLTIVTITKADLEGLRATLDSTEALRALKGVEQIVVDGDGDAKQGAESAGCRWIRQTGAGISDAFNEGMSVACGEWIWFLNSGDTVHELLDTNWLLGLLRSTCADVVIGAIHYQGESHSRSAPPLWQQWPLLVCWIPHPATLVRRSALAQISGFNPKLEICMDFDLWHRLLSKNIAVDIVGLPFARFDINGASQRRENRRFLAGENATVLWRNKGIILKSLCRNVIGVLSVIKHTFVDRWF
jgi:hypothetical protein